MRIPFLFLYFTLMPLFLFSDGDGDMEWKLVKQQKGISVYIRSVPETPINAIKATTTVNCEMATALAVILDAENHSNWMYQSKTAEVIEQISDTSWYYYAQTRTPWPAFDRDFVSKISVHRNNDKSISVIGVGIPDHIPEKENIVRLPYSLSEWRFTSLRPGTTCVELYLSVDIGGNLPTWIINMFITRGPSQTLINFSAEVKKEKYRNVNMSDIFPE